MVSAETPASSTLEQDPLPAPLAVPSAAHQRPSAVPDWILLVLSEAVLVLDGFSSTSTNIGPKCLVERF